MNPIASDLKFALEIGISCQTNSPGCSELREEPQGKEQGDTHSYCSKTQFKKAAKGKLKQTV